MLEVGYEVKISIETATGVFSEIKQATELGLAFQNEKDEWTPFGQSGWKSGAITAKSMTMGIKFKKTQDDPATDYILGIAKGDVKGQNGQVIKIEFPLTPAEIEASKTIGEIWEVPCVIEVGNIIGSAESLSEIEMTITSDGKPTITPATTTA